MADSIPKRSRIEFISFININKSEISSGNLKDKLDSITYDKFFNKTWLVKWIDNFTYKYNPYPSVTNPDYIIIDVKVTADVIEYFIGDIVSGELKIMKNDMSIRIISKHLSIIPTNITGQSIEKDSTQQWISVNDTRLNIDDTPLRCKITQILPSQNLSRIECRGDIIIDSSNDSNNDIIIDSSNDINNDNL